MSLRLKYLLPLNLVILLIWAGHSWWTISRVGEEFLRGEAGALEHLAVGLKYHLEYALRTSKDLGGEGEHLRRLAGPKGDLEILVIDEGFVVRAASDPARVGLEWHEPGIEDVLAGRSAESWNLRGHAHDGRRAIDATVGVRDEAGEVRFAIHIARWLDELAGAETRQIVGHLASALGLLLAVTVAINYLTYRLVIRPIDAVRREIAGSGLLAERSASAGGDEIARLHAVVAVLLGGIRRSIGDLELTIGVDPRALDELPGNRDTLEGVVERVSGELASARDRLARLEQLAALGQLSAGLAHELRNPLHIVRATAETAARKQPGMREFAGDIIEEVDRIEGLLEKLISYTRSTAIERQPVDLESLLASVKQRLCRCHEAAKGPGGFEPCAISVAEEVREIEADPMLLEQAVMNLFANAVEAGGFDGQVTLSAESDGAGGVVLTVADRGPGLPGEAARVFEPFFTDKPGGLGLGLPVVQKIADLHGGTVSLENREGGGAIARLGIPRSVPGGK